MKDTLHDVVEYRMVKKLTCKPKLMREAFNCKIDEGQAYALVAILNEEWQDCFYARKGMNLYTRKIKFIWHNRNRTYAKAGFIRKNRYSNDVRPYMLLPRKNLNVEIILHEYSHLITVCHCVEMRNKTLHARSMNKSIRKHNWLFVIILDYLLWNHQDEWRNI